MPANPPHIAPAAATRLLCVSGAAGAAALSFEAAGAGDGAADDGALEPPHPESTNKTATRQALTVRTNLSLSISTWWRQRIPDVTHVSTRGAEVYYRIDTHRHMA